jgi:hypothetical protein
MSKGTSSKEYHVFTLRYKLIAAVVPIFVFLLFSVGIGALLVWLNREMSEETRRTTHAMSIVLFTFVEFAIALLVLEFYPFLGGDILFEERLITKMKNQGRLTFDPKSATVNLIGITHPENVRWWKLDHDDDVGFMRMTETHFEYVGEAEDVKIPMNTIERISEQPYPFFSVTGLKWAIIDYKESGQPKRLFICARDKVSIRKAVAETRDIVVRLMTFCELARKGEASTPAAQQPPPQPPQSPSESASAPRAADGQTAGQPTA